MEVGHHNIQVKLEYQGHRSRSKIAKTPTLDIFSVWAGLIFLVFRHKCQGQCYSTDIFWMLNCWKWAVCSQSESISSWFLNSYLLKTSYETWICDSIDLICCTDIYLPNIKWALGPHEPISCLLNSESRCLLMFIIFCYLG